MTKGDATHLKIYCIKMIVTKKSHANQSWLDQHYIYVYQLINKGARLATISFSLPSLLVSLASILSALYSLFVRGDVDFAARTLMALQMVNG